MKKSKNCVFDVTCAGRTQTIVARSVGNACRIAFGNLIRGGYIKSQPHYDKDNKNGGLFSGVSVQVRGQNIASLGNADSFSDLTKRACARAGLPWIPPRSSRK